MKLISILMLITASAAWATTEEQINQKFTVKPGGLVVVDVDFGSIEVTTNATDEVVVDVWRKIGRKKKAEEEAFLKDHPVEFAQEGGTLTIRSRAKSKVNWGWSLFGANQTEGRYAISVPSRFNARLNTAGGGIAASDLTGDVNARTSGGGLHFTRLRGPLDGSTSGGGIHVNECEGSLRISTSGGGIDVLGGSGSLWGDTSGGSVSVRKFKGPAQVSTSGGGITIEEVTGAIEGSTSGGSIHAVLTSPLVEPVRLSTSGGGVTLRVPENAAFDLDAATSAGGVSSELPVTVSGKVHHDHLKGPVNGGGKPVVLRTSAGGIHIRKL
jgi:DUF4097 and DUF4098 domain-containing protein YvlB